MLSCSGIRVFSDEVKAKQDVQFQKSFDDSVDRGLAYLAKSQLPDGSFPGEMHKNTAITSLCVMAFLARGYAPELAPYGEVIDKGIDFSCLRSLPTAAWSETAADRCTAIIFQR